MYLDTLFSLSESDNMLLKTASSSFITSPSLSIEYDQWNVTIAKRNDWRMTSKDRNDDLQNTTLNVKTIICIWMDYLQTGGGGLVRWLPLAHCTFHCKSCMSLVSYFACMWPNTRHPLTRLCRRCVSSVLCANRCVSVLQQVSPKAACSRLSRRVWVSKTDQTWHTDWPHCSFLAKNRHSYWDMSSRQHLTNPKYTYCIHTYFLVLWVNLSVSLSRARAYSASMSPRRRRNSDRSESCCCFTSTWESKILIWSVNWARRSDTERQIDMERRRKTVIYVNKCLEPWTHTDMCRHRKWHDNTHTHTWINTVIRFFC